MYNSCPVCRQSLDKNKPIVKCISSFIQDGDSDFAFQLQMNMYFDEITLFTCSECDSDPCVCQISSPVGEDLRINGREAFDDMVQFEV
jgi:hypothetical protein